MKKSIFLNKYFIALCICMVLALMACSTSKTANAGTFVVMTGILYITPAIVISQSERNKKVREKKAEEDRILKEKAEQARQEEEAKKQAEIEAYNALSPEEKMVIIKQKQVEAENQIEMQKLAMQKQQMEMQQEQMEIQKQTLYEQQAHEAALMHCPKCGSTSISSNKKGYGVVKGAIGAGLGLATGTIALTAVGAGLGNIGRGKVVCTCMKCGYKWKAGKK